MADKTSPPDEKEDHFNLTVDYVKSNFHRVIHADGIYGGVSPHLKVITSFWNDRTAIPSHVSYTIKNGIPTETERVSRSDQVREVEVSVLMDLQTAKSYHRWLGGKIVELESALKEMHASEAKQKNDSKNDKSGD